MNDKQRQVFEVWCHNNPLKTDKRQNGDYKYTSTDLAWQAWRAAIASVVVELPCWSEYDTPRQAIEACADRIKIAGVKHNDE